MPGTNLHLLFGPHEVDDVALAGEADIGQGSNTVLSQVAAEAMGIDYEAMRIHLRRAFPAGATVPQLSEAMSYMLLPCGGPTLIDAVEVWEQAAKAGDCPAPYDD